jgi:hypothetical protein
MAQGYFVIDPLPWWRSRWVGVGTLLAAVGVAGVVAFAGWLTSPSDDGAGPLMPQPAVRPTVAVLHGNPIPPPAVTEPPPVAGLLAAGSPPPRREPPALSTEISPGVHITPLSVPPGTTPEPAGPREGDSEPEN